jgi:hypothetical protein
MEQAERLKPEVLNPWPADVFCGTRVPFYNTVSG